MKLSLFFFSLLWLLPACAQTSHSSDHSNIQVSGSGLIEAEPDMAILSISSTALGANSKLAKEQADQQYEALLLVLTESNVDADRIKVTRLSLQAEYLWSNNKRHYKGERVTRQLRIEIHQLEKLSSIIQQLVETGVSSIDQLQTGFIDEKKLTQQALGLAAQDAVQKAQFLAAQFDRELGQAHQIIEHNTSAPLVRHQLLESYSSDARSAIASAPDEMLGTQQIRADVNVQFLLK